MDLRNKTILITGAAGGLGSALALECAKLGAELILLDKNRRGLGRLSDEMTAEGMAAPGLYPLDLAGAGYDDFVDLLTTVSSEFDGLDALVHCAVDFEGLQPLDQIQPGEWLRSMQVNVNAPWLLSSLALPLLKNSNSGKLIFLLDDLEKVTGAHWGAYGAGKAAVAGLAKQFSDTLSNTAVKVYGILPGAMRTDFRAKVFHAENPLDQPDPATVASRITDILSGKVPSLEVIVDFSAS